MKTQAQKLSYDALTMIYSSLMIKIVFAGGKQESGVHALLPVGSV